VLTEEGWSVLGTAVPRLEAIAQSYGDLIRPGLGPYTAVAEELLDLLAEAAA
jgi:hypothetical protein